MNGAQEQLAVFQQTYPDAKYYLNFDTPFHLLIATILSAQCTDVVINKTTPKLYEKYVRPEDILAVSEEELAEDIKGITYYQAKAKYIRKTCELLIGTFSGEVPRETEKLTQLSGVGKKTANAIQQNAFDIVRGIVVDTHVIRLSQRLRWTQQKNPEKIEKDLMAIFPKSSWKTIPHLLKSHGQQICTARNPKCKDCVLKGMCPSAFNV